MGLFNKNNGVVLTPRQQLESKYSSAKANLLIVVAFTIINIIILATGGNSYFLFSAFVPYFIVDLGMVLCGKYPMDFYGEEFTSNLFFGEGVFIGFVVVAVILTLLYLLAWFLSKNFKKGWLIFALVFFSIDTVLMFVISGIAPESIIDIAFHIWVIVSLASGISASVKLAALPEEELPFVEETPAEETNQTEE